MKHFSILVLIATTMLTAGCMNIKGTVTQYEAQAIELGASVMVVPSNGQEQSLDFKVYKRLLEEQLAENGFVVASSQPSDYYIKFDYAIDHTGDTFNRSYTTRDAQGNVTGVSNVTRQIHNRFVGISFFDSLDSLKKFDTPIAQSRVTSDGESGDIAAVMPGLVKLVMKNWGRYPSGKSREYTVSTPR